MTQYYKKSLLTKIEQRALLWIIDVRMNIDKCLNLYAIVIDFSLTCLLVFKGFVRFFM